ncbi:hypothetical protein GE21DRAFT_9554 [Neurospora crassa]|uniref:Secreted protein n=1 Tax=Neurospora crassa (strain ATCC 24698 / 74-OR23-1A / CBS 708.71 / DSM 1257 / FGSC 987) TaxID=367110 RepID=Q7RXD2_NEUCR|nr:hypothetical protein NCU05052 [Neurospora crassa OR74A]EAA27190.1 hypothetical protein NCU05052 [Neurospora crassa OR74A]KHE83836.1 hypothetical protein GE21DRAFT_9554 [Neurospora crassa]|eukprot:XP_956426.1 hypothetical protein NCU05052 [Neurospora crassa OR74A]
MAQPSLSVALQTCLCLCLCLSAVLPASQCPKHVPVPLRSSNTNCSGVGVNPIRPWNCCRLWRYWSVALCRVTMVWMPRLVPRKRKEIRCFRRGNPARWID